MSLISPTRLAVLAGAGAAALFLRRRGQSSGGSYEPPASEPAPAESSAARESTPVEPDTAAPAAAATQEPSPEPDEAPERESASSPQEATTEETDALATPSFDPADLEPPPASDAVVMPDTSSDALVEEQTAAAAAEAGSVGGDVRDREQSEPGLPDDPAERVVVEGSGEAFDAEDEADRELGSERQVTGTPDPDEEP